MRIKSISLVNFRNWEEKYFDFSGNVLIYGPNARGKTNILEAIYMSATSRSFRGRDADVMKHDSDFLKINTNIIKQDSNIDIEIIFNTDGQRIIKEFKIKGQKRPTIDFVGEFSCVVFSPDDLILVSGPPTEKRKYLSFTIGQKDREYLYDLLNYKKILRQRNELLKSRDTVSIEEEIDIWDENLSQYGQKVIEKRQGLEYFINKRIKEYYGKLSGGSREVKFVYEPKVTESTIRASLRYSRGRDILERTTTVGPHRDDWHLEIDGVEASGYASRGEYRTLVLALKLCERDWFMERDGIRPIILLDDVFSELDEGRRKYLVEAFSGSQIIITTTDLDHLNKDLREDFQLININGEQPELFDNKKTETSFYSL